MESAAKKGNEEKEMSAKNYATYLIVSSLLVTSVLYAGFAMHRHVQSDYGPAILTRKGAFIVFVVAEAMTLILSIFSCFLAFLCWRNVKRNGALRKAQKLAMLYYSVTVLVLIGMHLVYISSNYVLHGMKLLTMFQMFQMVAFWCFWCFAITLT
uniref:uncharacterized protein LOC101314322 isoform X1 n=1 Tax=Fragaria vesca subsp. vesca TaxID=101020 RepID=UPI0005C88AAA|nr:PREDICTED: uncharacterized protein LOC101314322 isoform X1 [Fragaria vesca subsp. vesca]